MSDAALCLGVPFLLDLILNHAAASQTIWFGFFMAGRSFVAIGYGNAEPGPGRI